MGVRDAKNEMYLASPKVSSPKMFGAVSADPGPLHWAPNPKYSTELCPPWAGVGQRGAAKDWVLG